MSARRKAFKVRLGNRVLTVGPHARGWRFGYKVEGEWKYVTRKSRAEATLAAEEVLASQEDGSLVWGTLSKSDKARLEWVHAHMRGEEDWQALRMFIESRSTSLDVREAVARYLAYKEEEAGGYSRWLGQVRSVLEGFAGGFTGRRVADVSFPEIDTWWRTRCGELGPKTRKEQRGMLVTFFKWCRREGIVADAVTVAERLPTPKVQKGERRVLTVEELVAVLNEVKREFRAWVVLGAWAGLRPEEIAPTASTKRKDGRRGLRCEDIDWQFNVIRVPQEVAGKVGRPRIVPLCPTLRAALEWASIGPGMRGPVVIGDPWARETRRLGKAIFSGRWPHDVLRHSYASYRNAGLRDLSRLAEEMGTSVDMLHGHYHNPRPEQEGQTWFERVVLKCSDENAPWIVIAGDQQNEKPRKKRGL